MNKLLIIISGLAICLACGKSNSTDPNTAFFPTKHVSIQINTTLAQYSALSVQGGWVYEAGGNKGIVVYHTAMDEFVAYDRTCPHNPGDSCSIISVDSNGTRFMCGQYAPSWKPCCGSIFIVESGAPNYGPAKRALHAYTVTKTGDVINITN